MRLVRHGQSPFSSGRGTFCSVTLFNGSDTLRRASPTTTFGVGTSLGALGWVNGEYFVASGNGVVPVVDDARCHPCATHLFVGHVNVGLWFLGVRAIFRFNDCVAFNRGTIGLFNGRSTLWVNGFGFRTIICLCGLFCHHYGFTLLYAWG